jgi:hypothetical protein
MRAFGEAVRKAATVPALLSGEKRTPSDAACRRRRCRDPDPVDYALEGSLLGDAALHLNTSRQRTASSNLHGREPKR